MPEQCLAQHLKRPLLMGILMWSLGAIFYFYEFTLQVSPNVMLPELMRDFHVSASELGRLGAVYFYAYAIMQIPVGILLDRHGPRKCLTVAALCCALGSLLFGIATTLIAAKFARFVIGMGSAFAVVGTLTLAGNWFPINRFATLNGLLITIGMTGAVMGEEPLALLVEKIHWQDTLLLLGGIGIFIAAILWVILRDKPRDLLPANAPILQDSPLVASDKEKKSLKAAIKDLGQILKKRQSWSIAIYGGLMFGPTAAIGAQWGASFFMSNFGFERTVAAGITSLVFIGWAIGSPLFGMYSDHIRRRKPPMYIGSVGALVSFTALLYLPHAKPFTVGALLLIFGIFSSGFLPSYSAIRESHPRKNSATALGFMNMMNTLGVAAAIPVVGALLDMMWSGQLNNGLRVYSASNYHDAFLALPISIGLSLLVLPFIKETHCQEVEE